MKKNLLFLIFFLSICSIQSAFAARFYFEVPQQSFHIGEIIPVKIFIDTQKENVNTINLKINYPKDFLLVENASNSGSIINFWVEGLSGVIIGGYNGNRGLITQLNIKALKVGP